MFVCFRNHCLWKQSLDHLVHVVVGFEVSVSRNFVIVDLVLPHPLGELPLIKHMPIKNNIACSLVPELESALGLLVGHSSENDESLLGFFEIVILLPVVGLGYIDVPRLINFYSAVGVIYF